jgi:hypothetical protein
MKIAGPYKGLMEPYEGLYTHTHATHTDTHRHRHRHTHTTQTLIGPYKGAL